MKRVAAANALEREPTSPEKAVLFDCFCRIFGAGGKEAATMPRERTQGCLVEANQK